MRKLTALALMAVFLSACTEKKEEISIETKEQKVSYSAGFLMGERMQEMELNELNLDVFFMGMREGIEAKPGKITEEEMKTVLEEYQKEMIAQKQEELKLALVENLKASTAWLAENAKKEGVVTTESGLQYKIIKQGEGDSPAAVDTVEAHYHGTLKDGTVFDSSKERGQPASFALDRVIKGWTEGLQLMKPGAVFEFYIPPALGYGERGTQGKIGPNEVLVFEVELISVTKKEVTESNTSEAKG